MTHSTAYMQACVTLQAKTAHAIHSGEASIYNDCMILRDSNGLPTISGSSLAGLLRSLFEESFKSDAANDLFGYDEKQNGKRSRIEIDWGFVHDGNNIPQEGIVDPTAVRSDEVLRLLLEEAPILRDRVKLNNKGVAINQAKYDLSLVPRGTRYSLIIGLWGKDTQSVKQDWANVVECLQSPFFRLGTSVRSGLGLFSCISICQKLFDLNNLEDVKAYIKRPRSRAEMMLAPSYRVESASNKPVSPYISMNLKAENGWRIGGGRQALSQADPNEMPLLESVIVWHKNLARVNNMAVLPGSSLKGALAHRLVYHYCRLKMHWAESKIDTDPWDDVVGALFGNEGADKNDDAKAGSLWFEDIYIPVDDKDFKWGIKHHNRIDRFTGGVIKGALFTEEWLWQTSILAQIYLKLPEHKTDFDDDSLKALTMACEDICQGRLPLGAGGSRSMGVFRGMGEFTGDKQLQEVKV